MLSAVSILCYQYSMSRFQALVRSPISIQPTHSLVRYGQPLQLDPRHHTLFTMASYFETIDSAFPTAVFVCSLSPSFIRKVTLAGIEHCTSSLQRTFGHHFTATFNALLNVVSLVRQQKEPLPMHDYIFLFLFRLRHGHISVWTSSWDCRIRKRVSILSLWWSIVFLKWFTSSLVNERHMQSKLSHYFSARSTVSTACHCPLFLIVILAFWVTFGVLCGNSLTQAST